MMPIRGERDIDTSGIERRERSTLPHDERFPSAVRALLDGKAEYRDFVGYRVRPGTPEHREVLGFLIDELEHLPFDGSAGHAICMRPDAEEAVHTLARVFSEELQASGIHGVWNPTIPDRLRDVFKSDLLEVFKTEMYPDEITTGVCYSLDLGARRNFNTDDSTPSLIVLDRFHVSRENGEFHLTSNGQLKLRLSDGSVIVDIDESPITHIHTGEWRKRQKPEKAKQ